MTDRELSERITVWLNLAHQHPLPPPTSGEVAEIQTQVNATWERERLDAVAEMAVTDGIVGSLAGEALEKAIALARTKTASHLPEIEKLLSQQVLQPLLLSVQPSAPETYLDMDGALKPVSPDPADPD
jgi:glutathione S-transferase